MAGIVAEGQAATAAVKEYVAQALKLLEEGDAVVNSIGVFMQPKYRRAALLAAAGQLTAAAELIERTKWPTAKDYGEAGL